VGATLGLPLQLDDDDGTGRAARIGRGGGRPPARMPTSSGMLTLAA
jgi:hypothetical protein